MLIVTHSYEKFHVVRNEIEDKACRIESSIFVIYSIFIRTIEEVN
jgi:hypothetical protein